MLWSWVGTGSLKLHDSNACWRCAQCLTVSLANADKLAMQQYKHESGGMAGTYMHLQLEAGNMTSGRRHMCMQCHQSLTPRVEF